jgi:hypothetical protein
MSTRAFSLVAVRAEGLVRRGSMGMAVAGQIDVAPKKKKKKKGVAVRAAMPVAIKGETTAAMVGRVLVELTEAVAVVVVVADWACGAAIVTNSSANVHEVGWPSWAKANETPNHGDSRRRRLRRRNQSACGPNDSSV